MTLDHLPRLRRCLALVAIPAVLASAPAAMAARGPSKGTEMLITGTVTDTAGAPVEGVTLEFTASRKAFSLRDFRIRTRGARTLRTMTDSGGSFELRWLSHPYFNRFELVAGVEVGLPGGKTALREFESRDLSRRMRQEGPVVVTFGIADTTFVDAMRQLLAELDSDDEQRVYREMGKPDKVRHEQRLGRRESSWWYFDIGRVYRFHDGRLDSVDEFEPVAPPSSEGGPRKR